MMNTKLALIVSVSAYALQMNPVYASLLSSPPASILDTNIHTTTLQSSALNQSPLNVMLVLDTSIQVAKESILDLDPRVKPEDDNSFLVASVCFITDQGPCSGRDFGSGANTEDGGHGAPGGGTGDGDKDPDYELDNAKRCKKEGYNLTSCNSVQEPFNRCPYNNSYFEKCVCKPGLVTCTKPQYGVGESCGGKYASCQTDNPRACREDGYTNTCTSGQKLKKSPRCPYDSSFGIYCSPSCPQYTSTTSSSYGTNGTDGCGYACYYTCQMNCPSGTTESNPGGCGGSTRNGCGNKTCYYPYAPCCSDSCPGSSTKYYTGSYAGKTGCGNSCYYCKGCTSGSTSYSGSYAGSSECGSCYYCSDSCRSGSKSVSCTGSQVRYTASTTECGSSCYGCRACSNSCSSGSTSVSCTGSQIKYTSGSTECGATCYACRSCSNSCSSGSTSSSCSSGYTAVKVGTTECGSSCYSCQKSCVSGGSSSCSGQTSSCGSGQVQTSSCKDCNGTMHYSCRACSNTCSSGSTSVSCSSNQNKVSTGTTECGNTCYKCETKSCSVTTCTHTSKQTGTGWSCSSCTGRRADCSTYSGWNCYKSCTIDMGCKKYEYSCNLSSSSSSCNTNYRYTCTNTYGDCSKDTYYVCCPRAI